VIRSATMAWIRVNRKVYMEMLMIGGMGDGELVYKGIGGRKVEGCI